MTVKQLLNVSNCVRVDIYVKNRGVWNIHAIDYLMSAEEGVTQVLPTLTIYPVKTLLPDAIINAKVNCFDIGAYDGKKTVLQIWTK